MAAGLAVLGVIVLVLSVRYFPSARLSRVLVPVTGLSATIAVAPRLQRRHPDEPWLGRWLVIAVIVKEIASILRFKTFENGGDATIYDKFGKRFLDVWLHHAGAVAPQIDNIRKSNFLRWFTGSCTTCSARPDRGFRRVRAHRVRRLVPLVPRGRRSVAVPRPPPVLLAGVLRAEHRVLAVVGRQGSVDAVRDRQCGARNGASPQGSARARARASRRRAPG